jgi:catechol 2,3-dioxygenase-like lactoylglutathione lyase family enzyme
MEMSVGVLDHYNVSTRRLKETVQFYEEILGFVNGPRPQFNFPGAWLYSAGHAVLHLNDISQTDRQQRPDSGVIDHVAFSSRGFEATKQHLTGKSVPTARTRCPIALVGRFFCLTPIMWRSNLISKPGMRPLPEFLVF